MLPLAAVLGSLALAYWHFGPGRPLSDVPERSVSLALAKSLLQQGDFSNPYPSTGTTGPSALEPPVFPAALALVSRVAGQDSEVILFWLALTGIGLQGVLLVMAGEWLWGNAKVGWAAAIATALVCGNQVWLWSGPVFAANLTLAAVLITAWAIRQNRSLWLPAFASVAVLLTHAGCGAICVSFLAWILLEQRQGPKCAVKIAAAAFLLVLPWTLRNVTRLHAWVPVQDGFAIEFGSAFNDCAKVSWANTQRAGCLEKSHPQFSPEEETKMAAGEAVYGQARLAEGLRWVLTNREKAALLIAGRIQEFWFPSRSPGSWFIVLLGWGGLALLLSQRRAMAAPILASLLVYPLGCYLSLSRESDATPLLPFLALPAGYLIASFFSGPRKVSAAYAEPKQSEAITSVVARG